MYHVIKVYTYQGQLYLGKIFFHRISVHKFQKWESMIVFITAIFHGDQVIYDADI